jgi:hypothetical protein
MSLVDYRDVALAKRIGIKIEAEKNLPDIILVDSGSEEILIVSIEVVATAGPINRSRKEAFLRIVLDGGYRVHNAAFVSAYGDRASSAFRGAVSNLAWGSFAWFASEPEQIIVLKDGNSHTRKLFEFL